MSKLLGMMMSGGEKVEFKNYIYAIDNAYIETDIKLNQNYKLSIRGKAKFGFSGQYNIFFMAGNGSLNYWSGTRCMISNEGGSRYEYLNNINFNNLYITTGTSTNYKRISIGNNGYISEYTITLNQLEKQTDSNIILFFNNVENIYSNDIFKIAFIEIKDQNDNLVHELKPAIVNSENGVYDTITKTFYGNTNSVGSLVCE